mmetsp:Transcript_1511/g.1485  ORF Transcript_1511/g.1485 Transcript_1511/m.1485 type:complete len:82 (+) Transcript_1511:1764-2009(+)
MIREKNQDRLKFLQLYNDNMKYKDGLTYIKYSEAEEEELHDRLQKIDQPIYRMLNPEIKRIKYKDVPYKLESSFDVYKVEQ